MSYLRMQKNIFLISSGERFLHFQQVYNMAQFKKTKQNPKPCKFEFIYDVAIQNASSTPISHLKSIIYSTISVFIMFKFQHR